MIINFVDTLTASASYDFNESQMQGTREQEMIANNVIDRTLIRKLIQKLSQQFDYLVKNDGSVRLISCFIMVMHSILNKSI